MSGRNVVIGLGLIAIVVVVAIVVLRPAQEGAGESSVQTIASPTVAATATSVATSAEAAAPEPTEADAAKGDSGATGLPTVTPSSAAESPLASGQLSPLDSPLEAGAAPRVLPALPLVTYRVVNEFPHDPNAFTQGLVYLDGEFYESTGLHGHSSLRRVDPASGAVLQSVKLDDDYWGEGMTILGDRVYQLTYKSGVGFVYDKKSFDLQREFYYPTEGWGLTHDGRRLIMSDGSSTLTFLDPATLDEIGRLPVFDDKGPVASLNELEYIDGEVLAHIFKTDLIARISPETGEVIGWIDLTGLLPAEDRQQPVDVLNGLAYDAEGGRLFVTGKLWPKLFEIELVAPE